MLRKAVGNNRSAFTLTELLATVAIVALLLVLPCVGGNRERNNRIVCLNNLRQMGVGSQLYAADDPKGRLAGNLPRITTGSPGDDLNWLYGFGPSRTKLVPDIRTAVCPSTRNVIRMNPTTANFGGIILPILPDLLDNATMPAASGHSYEVVSFWPSRGDKTLQSVSTLRKTMDPFSGTFPGPAKIFLIYDAMDSTIFPQAIQNFPNPYAGHGQDGGNMLFCDGHAEWVSTLNWPYVWAVSQDTRPNPPP